MTGDFVVIKKGENDLKQIRSPDTNSYRSNSLSSGGSGLSSGLEAYNKAHPQGQPIKGRRRGLSDTKSPNERRDNGYSTSYDNHHNNNHHNGHEGGGGNSFGHSKGIAISKSVGGANHSGSGSGSFHPHSPGGGFVNSLTHLKSPPNASLMGSSPTYRNSAAMMIRRDECLVQPLRQPRGPDGTTGFSDDYKQQRLTKKSPPINQ